MLLYSMLCHFLVDAICSSCICGVLASRYDLTDPVFCAMVAVYNIIAFCTQPLTGWLCDTSPLSPRTFGSVILFLLLGWLGTMLQSHLNEWLAVILLGLGNSLFHVWAGREVILRCTGPDHDKTWPLGAYVAPGALGVTCGGLFPKAMIVACPIVLYLAFAFGEPLWKRKQPADSVSMPQARFDIGCMVLILLCVISRAAAGSCVPFPGRDSALWLLILTGSVVIGKSIGGCFVDRWGPWLVGCLALAASWACLRFGGTILGWHLAGQFAANLMMPLTLGLLIRLCPQRPGFMFGLAASMLYPGYVLNRVCGSSVLFSLLSLAAVVCLLAARRCFQRQGFLR